MKTLFWTATLAFAILVVSPAWAGIELSREYPQVNEPVDVTVTPDANDDGAVSGVPVTATYGPGSDLVREVAVGVTDGQGRVSWTPEEAGLVTLSAVFPGAGEPVTVSQNISVKFAGPPALGILVMAVAGLILYGGVVHGFTRLNKMVPQFPPDT